MKIDVSQLRIGDKFQFLGKKTEYTVIEIDYDKYNDDFFFFRYSMFNGARFHKHTTPDFQVFLTHSKNSRF